MNSELSIAILDDHPLILQALSELAENIDNVIEVVAFSNVEDFKEYLQWKSPSIAILDLRMHGKDEGLEMAKHIISRPDNTTSILIYSSHTDYYHIADCLNIGVNAYVSKDSPISEIKIAIAQILDGQNYNSPDVQFIVENNIKSKLEGLKNKDEDGYPSYLSQRELEVLTLICSGFTEEEIADRLDISTGTARKHRQNIMEKLNCNKVHYLYQYAITRGLISF